MATPSFPLMAKSVARAPNMYFDISESNIKNCLSAGAIPTIGCVTNTTEYMAKLDIISSTTQNVAPMISLMIESIWSGVHFRVSVPPA